MAKLKFKQNFTLEVGDDIYTGTIKDFTKKEKKEFDKSIESKNKLLDTVSSKQKQARRLREDITIQTELKEWESVKKSTESLRALEDEIESLSIKLNNKDDIEAGFKRRIQVTVESDDIDKILKAGEDYGYQNVFETILTDIREQSAKK